MQQPKWNKKTIEELYLETFPQIRQWVKKNSGNESDAEDVFQESLIAAFQKSKEPSFTLNCKMSTFIFGIAKKNWLYKLRTKGRHVATDFSQSEAVPEEMTDTIDGLIENQEIDNLYKSKFQSLTEECKKILTYFFNGTSMKEIVVKMGYENDGFARKKKFNCKNQLVEMVKDDPRYLELRA
ncbi:MAG: sigma-70 family RNA polymerase sigma factor [Bacteroidota bacterium]